MMSENEVFMIHSYKQNYKTNIGRKCEWVEENGRIKKVMAWMKMMISSKQSEKLKEQNTINECGKNKDS